MIFAEDLKLLTTQQMEPLTRKLLSSYKFTSTPRSVINDLLTVLKVSDIDIRLVAKRRALQSRSTHRPVYIALEVLGEAVDLAANRYDLIGNVTEEPPKR